MAAQTTQKINEVKPYRRWRTEFEEVPMLLGLLRLRREVKRTKMYDELHITTDLPPEAIFLNGKKLMSNQPTK